MRKTIMTSFGGLAVIAALLMATPALAAAPTSAPYARDAVRPNEHATSTSRGDFRRDNKGNRSEGGTASTSPTISKGRVQGQCLKAAAA